ncbi:MAG: hypothetical protein HXS44_05910 [Theionarchaea archaeon]|nr:hypothetical protein [Theionarchaea archaeon]
MSEENIEDNRKLCIEVIEGIEGTINRGAAAAQQELNWGMQKIGKALYDVLPGTDLTKIQMVSHADTMGRKISTLVVHAVNLARNTLILAKTAYGDRVQPKQIDRVPLCLACADMGNYSEGLFSEISESASNLRDLKDLASTKSSTTTEMIDICCKLVQRAHDLEKNVVTENKWEGDENIPLGHLRGIVGYTYDILRTIDRKIGTTFQEQLEKYLWEANSYLDVAETLLERVNDFPDLPPTEDNARQATTYLGQAIDLLENVSEFMERASDFVGTLP